MTEHRTCEPPTPKRSKRTNRGQIPTKPTRRRRNPSTTGTAVPGLDDDRFPARDRSTGQLPKLTAEVREKICQAVAIGIPFNRACWLAGIDDDTGREWLARGQGRDRDRPMEPRYAAFAGAVEKARAQDIAARVARVTRAGRGGAVVQRRTVTRLDGSTIVEERFSEPQWTADMTMLERRYPEEFGRRVALEHGGQVGVVEIGAIQEAMRRATERRKARLVSASSTAAPPQPPSTEDLEIQPGPLVPSSTSGNVIPLPRAAVLGEGRPPLLRASSPFPAVTAVTSGDGGTPGATQDTESEASTSEGEAR